MADTTLTCQSFLATTLSIAKDPNSSEYAYSELLIYLNKGRDHIHKTLISIDSDIVLETGTITLVASTQAYTLPDDFWSMRKKGVYYDDVKPLYRCTHVDVIRNGTDTTDTYVVAYELTDTQIKVVPIPTATSVAVDNTLNLEYYARPANLAISDNMPYKNMFNEPLGFFVDSMARLRLEDTSAGYAEIYNLLEEQTLEIARLRGKQ